MTDLFDIAAKSAGDFGARFGGSILGRGCGALCCIFLLKRSITLSVIITAVRFGRRHGWMIGAYISVTCRSSTAALYVDA
jgi:hypothetical protein